MLSKVKGTIYKIVAFVNILVILAMIVTGFSGYINPVPHKYISVLTIAFPVALIANILCLIFWMTVRFRLVLIPLTGFIICYLPTRLYFPLNNTSDIPEEAIKIISYNVSSFREYDYPEGQENPIVNYLRESKADIICLQETSRGERVKKLMKKNVDGLYPYQDFVTYKGNGIALLSKFPIIDGEDIKYQSSSNMSKAWNIKIGKDTILIVNNHLESNKLSESDRYKFKKLIKENLKDENAKEDTKWLYKKLAIAAEIRASQADSVARYIKMHQNRSMIVCGDFNDSPLSYSRRVISKGLTDCFVEKGNGPGISYHTGGFYVRIDNIMCSRDWNVFKCEVDNKISASDHYPICSWIKRGIKQ